MLAENGQHDRAIDVLLKGLKKEPNDAPTRTTLAVLLIEKKRYKECAPHLRLLISADYRAKAQFTPKPDDIDFEKEIDLDIDIKSKIESYHDPNLQFNLSDRLKKLQIYLFHKGSHFYHFPPYIYCN